MRKGDIVFVYRAYVIFGKRSQDPRGRKHHRSKHLRRGMASLVLLNNKSRMEH
jgi:hypothetical protein